MHLQEFKKIKGRHTTINQKSGQQKYRMTVLTLF